MLKYNILLPINLLKLKNLINLSNGQDKELTPIRKRNACCVCVYE